MKKPENRQILSWVQSRSAASAPVEATVTKVRRHRGFYVESFDELVSRVAQLAFANPDYLLFFRGQKVDHRNDYGKTSIKPSIFRPERGQSTSPRAAIIKHRYLQLAAAEQELVNHYRRKGFIGADRVERFRILRWAILQHYEVCATPFVDITHSLRVAALFASLNQPPEAFIMVLALPNLAGSVTASSEEGVQVLRLSSICPPDALRPHYQEGYLLGEYPEIDSIDAKANFESYEIDCARRLIAKFRFKPAIFWGDSPHFPQIPVQALYPNGQDQFYQELSKIPKQSQS